MWRLVWWSIPQSWQLLHKMWGFLLLSRFLHPLHPITAQFSCANIQKHLRDIPRLENSIKSKHNSCFAEKPLTHTPREPVEASAEFLMTLTGQQCRKVFLHCRTLCCHFWAHVRVSDFKLKWQIAPWVALSKQRTLTTKSSGRKVRPPGWLL